MRLSIAVLAAIAVLVAAAAPARAQGCSGAKLSPRLSIPLFRYQPASDAAARAQFELFRSLLSQKLSALADEARGTAVQSGMRASEFPSDLTLYLPQGQPIDDTLDSSTQRRTYWEQSNSLELLRGRIWPGPQGRPYDIQSDIYIGELRGAFPRPEITVQLAITPDEASTTMDSHSAVTYFALGMEARRLSCDQAITRAFLARAKAILKDIQGRTGGLSKDLAALAKVIDDDLRK
jgi:hypothetical protein